MIVKNEEKVLPRLFRSVKDYIDYYVIVDTGSTDGTIALIKSEMSAAGIEGEVHERPWVNFGVNRQQALELALAADKCDWLLFIDADEELGVSDPKFYEKLVPGQSYDIEKHQGDLRYAVPHLPNIRTTQYRWEGPVHNCLVAQAGDKRRKRLQDTWIVYHPEQGAKSHNLTREQKYLKDAAILEEYLKEHPDHPRSLFYLGQSYRDAGHWEQALEAYKRRAQVEGWEEETFMAQLEVGRMSIRLDKPEPLVLGELIMAYNLRPTRAEPLYELARYFRNKKTYPMASLFAKAGVQTPCPPDLMYVVESVYSWRLWDELAVASSWTGDFVTARRAGETILERVKQGLQIPEHELVRIRINLEEARSRASSR
jgi:hypothetical protein